MDSRLTALQSRVLETLRGLGWTLTGGGALAGFHLGHRPTRDLDLFFHGAAELGPRPREVRARLVAAGLEVHVVEEGRAFCRLTVSDGRELVPVDLVAEPVPTVDPPFVPAPGLQVDSAQEILTNKLGALLSRWEVRDLVDVQALVAAGADLDRALADAPRKDGGFSPPTLAWVLATTPAVGLAPDLLAFRDALVARLRA